MNFFNFKNKTFLCILAIIVIGSVIYSFNFSNKLFWDDEDWIINNVFLHKISLDNIGHIFSNSSLGGIGLSSNYYRPFLFSTFGLNYVISGEAPFTYHLISNALHIANAVLLFLLLLLLFKNKVASFIASLIFLVHPVQTEAVSYISGRGDPLHLFFMLLALWLIFRRLPDFLRYNSKIRIVSYVLLALAILSQEKSIIFPFLFTIVYVVALYKDSFWKTLKKSFIEAIPYFSIVIVYGVMRLTILNFVNTLDFYSTSNIYSENLHVRFFTFLHSLLVYYKIMIFPTGLHMERSLDLSLSFLQLPVILSFLFLLFLLWIVYFLYKQKDKTQDVFYVWFFGVFWFFISLAPVSGITPINAILYEHWLHVGIIGPAFIVGYYFSKLLSKFEYNKIIKLGICIVAVIYLGFFSVQSIKRNIIWGKPIEFYEDILKYEPDSPRVNNNLGNEYSKIGDKENALKFYKKAIENETTFPQPYFNIGHILLSDKNIIEAIGYFKKAVEIDPNFYLAWQGIAQAYAEQGNIIEAIGAIEKLKNIRPNDPSVFYNSALIYDFAGDNKKAIEDVKIAINLSPQGSQILKLSQDLLNILSLKK